MPDDLYRALSDLEGGLDRVVEPAAVFRTHHQPVHHHRDVVIMAAVEHRHRVEVVGLSVYPDPDKAPLAEVVEELLNSPLRPCTIGPSTSILVSAGQLSTVSVIWLALCRDTGLPSLGQWGTPARAQSSRM